MSYKKIESFMSEIGIDKLLRFNYRTTKYKKEIAKSNENYKNTIRIKNLFNVLSGYAFSSNDYIEEGVYIVRIGDLNNYKLNYDNMAQVPSEYYESEKYQNYIVQKGDILISLTGDGNLKCLLFDDDSHLLLNQRVAILRPKDSINVAFYYWLLKSYFVKSQFTYYSNGKSQLNISPFDLANIKIPVIDEETQKECMKKIFPRIEEINRLLLNEKKINNVINDIFGDFFNYDYHKFEDSKKEKKFNKSMSDFGNNIDLRFSAKFHRNSGTFVYSELKNRPHKLMKKIIEIPTITGHGISPNDFDDKGEYSYVSMADMSEWKIDVENLKRVSVDYSESHKSKRITGNAVKQPTTLLKGDIILMRSGEGGIGKTAIVENDIKAIFCDFIIRIRVNKKMYNPYFFYYFTRTAYFQYLVEINKKGLGNNTNIFPNILNNFPIPYISIEEQNRIVEEIDKKIEEQNDIENQIEKEQEIIEKILSETIK